MNPNYKLVVFDLDGTLLNTLDDLADSLNDALARAGYPVRTPAEVRSFIGNGIRRLVERGVPNGTAPEDVDRVFDDFTQYYSRHCLDKTRPYDGIVDLVRGLRRAGCKTAVVSNKSDTHVRELCARYFNGLFDAIVGERQGVRRKPFPDSVNEVLRQLQVEKKDAVYVGDSEVDIETARNAEMEVVIVDWGFRDAPFLRESGAKTVVSTTSAVAEFVLEKSPARS